jgi:succinate dehydrogenase/fumarate reductase flavoprotein subunit
LNGKSRPSAATSGADVVVIGAGATGITAAVAARELGASVIVVEAENHIGGHAICSGGNISLGGGNIYQKKYGVDDSPDRVFRDLIDWTVVEPNGAPPYRYNDHELAEAFANNSVAAFDFLAEHGVRFIDQPPDNLSGHEIGMSAPRTLHAAIMDWPAVQTGKLAPPAEGQTTSSGNGLMQPLYAAARNLGVIFLLRHRMTAILREQLTSGRVKGVSVVHDGIAHRIDARKAVIVGTGGSSGNVNFRRMFDPRLTEEYCGLAGMPWSNQDASGELAAMEIGASLWGLTNFSGEYGTGITKPGSIGCQYGYANLRWFPGSEVFAKARAIGLKVADWQNVILVNMLGRRFYDETARQFTPNRFGSFSPYTPGDWRNTRTFPYNPSNFINAALAGVGDGQNGGGPIWAIFDADAVAREGWEPMPPHVDCQGGFFFTAESIEALAASIVMKHQRIPMPPEDLVATIARYNGFVDAGQDTDFDKLKPRYKIERPPFFAAWATPVIHDSRAGLRINSRCEVLNTRGEVIKGLYCGGESAGGLSLHGLPRAICQGLISGREAALASDTNE